MTTMKLVKLRRKGVRKYECLAYCATCDDQISSMRAEISMRKTFSESECRNSSRECREIEIGSLYVTHDAKGPSI